MCANNLDCKEYLLVYFIVGKTIGRRLDVNRSELHSVQVNLATVHEGW